MLASAGECHRRRHVVCAQYGEAYPQMTEVCCNVEIALLVSIAAYYLVFEQNMYIFYSIAYLPVLRCWIQKLKLTSNPKRSRVFTGLSKKVVFFCKLCKNVASFDWKISALIKISSVANGECNAKRGLVDSFSSTYPRPAAAAVPIRDDLWDLADEFQK